VQEPLDKIHIAAAKMLTSTGRIDVLAATTAAQYTCSHSAFDAAASKRRFRSSGVSARPTGRWRSGKFFNVIRERSPPAAELQHPRKHAHVHVDRAIGLAGIVTGVLELGKGVSAV
jgi:hypothetical protein